ncbi:MFS transporter [Microvirga sp. 0TCS3.31]
MAIETTTRGSAAGVRWPRWTLGMLAAVNFMVILDSQIVILALPSIATEFSVTSAQAQWVMSAYLLAFGGLLLLGGRLGDRFGSRRVFMVGTVLFGVASLLCGLAWTLYVLIAARAVHGLSAALMAPTALALLITSFEDETHRTKALAVWGAVGGLGATAALLIGGALTDLLGWEWIFFINLPVAAGLLALAPVLLPDRQQVPPMGIDLAGAVLITMALACLCLVVVRVPAVGWADPETVLPALVASAALAAFVLVERRATAPLVPLELFRSATFAYGNTVMFLVGMAAWGVGLGASVYAQQVLGYTPLRFGLATAVLTVSAVAGSFAAQAALARRSARAVALAGLLTAAVGVALLSLVSPAGSYAQDLLPGLLLFGLGLGSSTVAASVLALAAGAASDAGVRSAVNTAAFQLGGAMGAAVVGSTIAVHSVTGDAVELTDAVAGGFVTTAAFLVVAAILAVRIPQRGAADTGDAGNDVAAIREVIERWARNVAACDVGGVLVGHTRDVTMFDVPPPSRGVEGLDGYAETWPMFFEWLARRGHFSLTRLTVEADRSAGFAHALVRCEDRDAPPVDAPDHLRITFGLRKVDGSWLIAHEHHSYADRARGS